MTKQLNAFLILGFSLLSLLLLASAAALFFYHHGIDSKELYIDYAGDEKAFINPKTFTGILKSFSPHILVMPLIFFILFHLAIATRAFPKEQIKYIAMVGFTATFGDIFINFIISWSIFFAYLKLLFFFLFQFVLIYIISGFFKKVFLER
ncbi:MAG: hypothetical protein OEW60_01730 [Thiovulaceae bacterium]|nr:hypothetical protein [Sulfurimonadaceae bacterium]